VSPLLPALRALTSFSPQTTLPACDLDALAPVLVAHGLAPIASWHCEQTRLGAGLPDRFRETLLGHFSGTVNDNVLRLVTLRNALKDAAEVPVVLLDGAAYVDWLYPHMAWRPVSDLRLAVRGADGRRFADGIGRGMKLLSTGDQGRTATFSDGSVELSLQEGLWRGAREDHALFARATPAPAFGPRGGPGRGGALGPAAALPRPARAAAAAPRRRPGQGPGRANRPLPRPPWRLAAGGLLLPRGGRGRRRGPARAGVPGAVRRGAGGRGGQGPGAAAPPARRRGRRPHGSFPSHRTLSGSAPA
jgi:hypothetical protein